MAHGAQATSNDMKKFAKRWEEVLDERPEEERNDIAAFIGAFGKGV